MASIECRSAQRGVRSVLVEVDGITDSQVNAARVRLEQLLDCGGQISTAVAKAFLKRRREQSIREPERRMATCNLPPSYQYWLERQ